MSTVTACLTQQGQAWSFASVYLCEPFVVTALDATELHPVEQFVQGLALTKLLTAMMAMSGWLLA